MPSPLSHAVAPTLYDQVIAPHEKKIIWYHLKELPRVDPTEQTGDATTPQALEKRRDVIISVAPEAEKATQLVFRRDTKDPLPAETPAPNMLAMEGDMRQRNKPKTFSPPAARTMEPQLPVPIPPAPSSAPRPPDPSTLAQVMEALPKLRRAFVPPPVAPAVAKVRSNLADLSPPQPDAGVRETSTAGMARSDALAKSLTRLPGRPFVAPATGDRGIRPQINVPDPASNPGGEISAAVLSASPATDLFIKLPEGVRAANVSVAPRLGPRATGAVGTNGSPIPGLVLQPGNTPPDKPSTSAPSEPIVYEDTRIVSAQKTLSAPLRPSSRTIPAAIEARFHGRVVYTMVIPMPRLPLYAGDWILWFAESGSSPGSASQMRAPLPVRKYGVASVGLATQPTGRIKLSAHILKNGRIESVELVDKPEIPSKKAAVLDLECWNFEPALKDGQPVDVEIYIEIPYQ